MGLKALSAGITFTSASTVENFHARFNRWPVTYFPLDYTDGELIDAKEWEGLLCLVGNSLITCERIYEHMTTLGADPVDWKDLQPPELVAMLDAIRKLGS